MSGILGVILAGGLARRMGGGDKGMIEIAGRPIIQHIIDRQITQTGAMIINAHGDPTRFAQFGLPVVPDLTADHAGPLAGVLAGMRYAQEHHPELPWVLTLPGDTPFMPPSLGRQMLDAIERERGELACAQSNGRDHPVIGLWPVRLADALDEALNHGMRKIDRWTARYKLVSVHFPHEPFDPFFNLNHPDQVNEAELIFRQSTPALDAQRT